MKKLTALVVMIAVGALVAFVYVSRRPTAETPAGQPGGKSRLKITTSIYPLYFIASYVAGDNADVTNLVPAGAEPHDFEPTSGDVATVEKSQVVFMVGANLEPWLQKMQPALEKKQIHLALLGDNLADRDFTDEDGDILKDPHVWLDPVLMGTMVDRVVSTLSTVDPKHADGPDGYVENGKTLKLELRLLDEDFDIALLTCARRDFFTSHAAFGYLAGRYNLTQVPIAGLSPDEEPSPKQLAEVAKLARAKGATHIFFETLVSPKFAETIAEEIGAQTAVLNPLEGLSEDELATGKNYFSVMRDNLLQLRTALACP